MKKTVGHSLAIANCYIGALIGAGFASGQELFQFFARFSCHGLFGVVLAGLLFAALGGYVISYKYAKRISSYDQMLIGLLGKKLGRIIDLLITFMLFAGLVVMLAGCRATLAEQFKMETIPALTLSCALILFTMFHGEQGVLQFNNLLIPFLGIVTIMVAGYAIYRGWGNSLFIPPTSFAFGSWLLSAILYVSYNMVLGSVILSSLEIDRPSCFWGGVIGGLSLGFLALIIVLALMWNFHYIAGEEVPMLILAGDFKVLKLLYALVLLAAMLTTAVANLYSLIKRIGGKSPVPTMLLVILLLGSACLITPFGFTRLIAGLYPLFGYLGFVLLGGILVSFLRNGFKYAKSYFKI